MQKHPTLYETTVDRLKNNKIVVIILLVVVVLTGAMTFFEQVRSLVKSFTIGWSDKPKAPQGPYVLAGVVTDADTKDSIGQAEITLLGRGERDTSEDNGTFRIELKGELPPSGRVRVQVTKTGYGTYDETVAVPEHELVVTLRRR